MGFPCRSCGERRPGCHGGCERYHEAVREWKEKTAAYKQGRRGYNEAYRLKRDSVGKTMRRNGGKKPW